MRIPSTINHFLFGKRAQPVPDENAELQHAWSISARLAAVSEQYSGVVPGDLANLIREAKLLHPEVAQNAMRRNSVVTDGNARHHGEGI